MFYEFIKMIQDKLFFHLLTYGLFMLYLVKNPRLSNACSAYHQSVCFGILKDIGRVIFVYITICNKRNFKTKRNFNLAISPYGESRAEFTGSNVDIGGSLSYSFYEKHTKASYANFKATDSKINIKNDLTVIIPFNGRFKNPAKRGGKIELEGKTTMSFGNGTVIDSLIKDMPTEWMFRFIFREKDGNIPTISFEKEANLDGCEFEFDISGNFKEVKSKFTPIPPSILPANIATIITHEYPNAHIVKIERKILYYEIKLSNQLELKIDTNGTVLSREFDD